MSKSNLDFSALTQSLSNLDGTILKGPLRHPCAEALPSRHEVIEIVELLRSILFPGYFGISGGNAESLRYHIGHILDGVRQKMLEQVRRGLCFDCSERARSPECDHKAQTIVESFLANLPSLRETLLTDVQAAYEGDPAATSPDETIFCYPGLRAITNYRVAHRLYALGVPLLPRMITEHAHSRTGVDIHPAAQIGSHFFIDHGTGVVIGATCILGNHVRLYQGVTLGAKSFALDENGQPIKGIPRHPILEDDVVVYAGTTILGRITIGKGSIIGGNVWLTQSVPPGSKVTQPTPQTQVSMDNSPDRQNSAHRQTAHSSQE
jgi:serine O-acetyltransferase